MLNPKKHHSAQGSCVGTLCARKDCEKEGLYKAPTSHKENVGYTWFCLEHIREYNAKWDALAGCNEAQIEKEIRSSALWDRPTWSFASAQRPYNTVNRAKPQGPKIPAHVLKAIHVLKLKPPYSRHRLKERYRALAKKYHPDSNNGTKTEIEKFHTLQQALKTVEQYLKKEGTH